MAEDRKQLIKRLKEESKEMRKLIVNTAVYAAASHVAPAFSAVETTIALYSHIMRLDPKNPRWEDRDRFIMSAGHKCLNQYVALAMKGYIPMEQLKTFDQLDSCLGGHPIYPKCPGVDVSTGSLGHGLPIGIGMAIGAKKDKKDFRTFVLMGDGECHEGSVWEAAMCAPKFKLDNLIAIVDYNKMCYDGWISDVLPLEPFAEKWRTFGWACREVDGHNMEELVDTFESLPFEKGKPSAIIANTIKGKGVSFMTNQKDWHFHSLSAQEAEQAIKEIEAMD